MGRLCCVRVRLRLELEDGEALLSILASLLSILAILAYWHPWLCWAANVVLILVGLFYSSSTESSSAFLVAFRYAFRVREENSKEGISP